MRPGHGISIQVAADDNDNMMMMMEKGAEGNYPEIVLIDKELFRKKTRNSRTVSVQRGILRRPSHCAVSKTTVFYSCIIARTCTHVPLLDFISFETRENRCSNYSHCTSEKNEVRDIM